MEDYKYTFPYILNDRKEIIKIDDYLERLYELQKSFDNIDIAISIILGSRLSLRINNVEYKQSNILNSGIGIFAIKKITIGEIITFYPGDYILYRKSKNKEIVILGDIIRYKQIKNIDYKNEYGLNVSDKFSICGEPIIRDNPTYLGHLINDGYKPSIKDTEFDYKNKSKLYENCEFVDINGLHTAIVATKDINIGDELYISYGWKYWISRIKK